MTTRATSRWWKPAAAGGVVAAMLVAAPVAAEVIRIDITSREPFGEDVSSRRGPYERIRGVVVYSLDTSDEANARIVDLELAATDGQGHVQFYGDI